MQDIQFSKRGGNLGKGAYGEVEMATHKRLGIKLAIKKIDKRSLVNKKIRATLLREVDIHKRLKHENIIRLYASCEDADYIYLVLEYAEKGNLFFFIRNNKKRLSEEEAFHYFVQTCSGIYFLHKNGLLHRDIKPENLLLSFTSPDQQAFTLKICDFGWCVQTKEDLPRNTFCGTLEYMAPEMLSNAPYNHTLDVWSLGILLYELVHGNAPFTGKAPHDIQAKIMKRLIKFNSSCSPEYRNLVESILQIDSWARIPLIRVFDHPWVLRYQPLYEMPPEREPSPLMLAPLEAPDSPRAEEDTPKNQKTLRNPESGGDVM